MKNIILTLVVAAFSFGLTILVPAGPVYACGDTCDCNSGKAAEKKAEETPRLVAQPEAKVGDKTLCPVSGSEFTIEEGSAFVEHDGKKIFVCCAGCGDAFSKDAEKLLTAHVVQVEEANKAE